QWSGVNEDGGGRAEPSWSLLATDHWLETHFPPDVTDVVFIGGVVIDGGQRERGGAAEDASGVSGRCPRLGAGDGPGPGPPAGGVGTGAPRGRVEEGQGAVPAGGEVLGDQVHMGRHGAGDPGPADAGAGDLQQDIEPVAGDRQRGLADAGLAVLVDEVDGEP